MLGKALAAAKQRTERARKPPTTQSGHLSLDALAARDATLPQLQPPPDTRLAYQRPLQPPRQLVACRNIARAQQQGLSLRLFASITNPRPPPQEAMSKFTVEKDIAQHIKRTRPNTSSTSTSAIALFSCSKPSKAGNDTSYDDKDYSRGLPMSKPKDTA
ncbi:hypothetical protein CCM_05448 [Cordyceps militaris CM01]|uniref:Uncharacterized protein n=1 Tax=Cordyceps militaris (strain CM01) TaxID=983644 RepID=G3JJQ0_CORMM|nr:uncharacterized protein CCM_05448 [Cordyceps militaris CM01]EGX91290.1 hypothetical protein CCM_05448 [Cordyceps militaris CM01]